MAKIIIYMLTILFNVWIIGEIYPDNDFLLLYVSIITSTITILQALDSYRGY